MATKQRVGLISSSGKRGNRTRGQGQAIRLARLAELAIRSHNEAAEGTEAKRTGARPDRDKPLNVRVPREIKQRLRRLKFQLDERELGGNMAELVHLWLSDVPNDVDEILVT